MTLITSLLVLGRKRYGVKQGVFEPELSITLGDIPGIRQANPRYVDLSFLAAHDANTCATMRNAALEPAASHELSVFRPILQNYVCRYVKTQTASIYDLLKFGCRFLHIKVTKVGDEWYTSHSLLTGKLDMHILDALRFLSEHEMDGEIVSFLFQPIYFGDDSFADFHQYLSTIKYKGKSLFDYFHLGSVSEFGKKEGRKIGEIRYNDVVGSEGQTGVVFFERRDQHYLPSWDAKKTAFPYFFDMDTNAFHDWHDHSSVRLLDRGIASSVRKIVSTDRYSDLLRMNQTQPSSTFRTFSDVIASLYSLSLLATAKKHNTKLLDRPDFDEMLKAMPVFQVDFLTSDYGDFNRRINRAIRRYNEKLIVSLL